jgi:uncharacterized membrane protein
MSTTASIKGHPIHAMLVPIPIGLWIFALAADVMVHLRGGQGWRTVAFYCLGGGVVGALLAAIPGLIDLATMGPGKSRRIGIGHMAMNLLAVLVFGVDFLTRFGNADHSGMLRLTALGVVLILISGWLGGEMVYVGGIGVAPAAPTSETRLPKETI